MKPYSERVLAFPEVRAEPISKCRVNAQVNSPRLRVSDTARAMADRMQSGLCPTCGEQRLLRQPRPNHVLHLILTVLTLGVWGLVWVVLVARASNNPARCTVCGTPLRKLYDSQQGTHLA